MPENIVNNRDGSRQEAGGKLVGSWWEFGPTGNNCKRRHGGAAACQWNAIVGECEARPFEFNSIYQLIDQSVELSNSKVSQSPVGAGYVNPWNVCNM